MLLSVVISLQKVLNTTLLKMFSKHLSECYIITGWGINSSLWERSLQCYWNTSFLTVNERALIVAGTTLLSIQDNFLAFLVDSQLFQSFHFGKYIHYFSFF